MTTPQPDAAPKFIFLQDYEAGHEATWCSDKINDDDVQYVRADELTTLRDAVTKADDALNYILGCGDELPERGPNDGAFYWRKGLADRAGLIYDGKKYVRAGE